MCNSYMDIPDAPWIRDAELNGMPEADPVFCPVCGEQDPEDLYLDTRGDPCGCSECLKRVDAYDWLMDRKRRGVA